MVEMFSTPAFYQPPPDDQLSTNTDYPNLNSREYLTRPYTVTPASSRRFNECLSVNDLGNAVLVSNSYTDRIWHGHFWGFETLSDVESGEAKSSFRRQCKATVSQLQYVDTTMVSADLYYIKKENIFTYVVLNVFALRSCWETHPDM